MILNDRQIRERGLVLPFTERALQAAGYDIRLDATLERYGAGIVPGAARVRVPVRAGAVLLPPGAFFLGWSVEWIAMPEDLCGVLFPRSSVQRLGLALGSGFIQPGFCARLVLELSNPTANTIRLVVGEAIAQIRFETVENPERAYAGQYQGQGE